MQMSRVFSTLCVATVMIATAFAQTEVVTNGSFESGLTGWTAAPSPLGGSGVGNDSNTTCGYNATGFPGTESIKGTASLPPSTGSGAAIGSAQDTASPAHDSSCVLYQDVAIPVGATVATLSIKWGLIYVGINRGSAALVAGLYSTASVPYFTNTALNSSGTGFDEPNSSDAALRAVRVPASGTFNVANLAGTTVRLALFNAVAGIGAGKASIAEFDDVSLMVTVPPNIAQAFGTANIPRQGSTSVTYTITNPAAAVATATGIGFTNNLPSGLVVANPNGVTGSCGGGTITATAGASSISLAGASLEAGGSCNFSVNVTGTTAGVKNNSVTVTFSGSGPTNTATASVTVVAPPTIAKAFGGATVGLGANTSLTFTVTNPNATVAASGVSFTDALPAGLVVATPNGLSGACGGGAITAAAGSGSVSLSGGTLSNSASCNFSVNVTGISTGLQSNTTGTIVSNEGGTGLTASANVTVVAPDLTLAKTHSGTFIQGDVGRAYTITVTNSGVGSTSGLVSVVDTLPVGLTATAISGSGWSCTLATATCTRSDALSAGSSYPAITVTVTVAPNAAATVINSAVVSGGSETNTANDTATDATTINPISRFLVTAPATATAGTAITFSVTAQDAFGNTGTGYAGTVHFTSNDGQAVLAANATLTNGTGSFTATLKTAGARTITATDTVTASITGSSATITVAPAPTPNASTVSGGTQQTAIVGTGFSTTLQVLVKDAYGNPMPGVSVVFTAPTSGPSVTFTNPSTGLNSPRTTTRRRDLLRLNEADALSVTAITNSQGIASVNAFANGWPGGFAVTATVGSLQTVFSLVNLPAPALNPQINPTFLILNYKRGDDPAVSAATLSITGDLAGSVTVSAVPAWVSVSPLSGPLPAKITVKAGSTTIATGFYTGSFVLTFSDQSVVSIPVQLFVSGPPQVNASVSAAVFTAQAGTTTAVTQDIVLQSSGQNVPVAITATGGAWLSASANASTTPATIHVVAKPDGLAAGVYSGTIVATATGASNSPLSIPVTFTLTAKAPAISLSTIANGASFVTGSAAPNTIVSAMGTFPGCTAAATVSVDGNETAVFYSSSTQVSFLVPESVANEAAAQVQISCAGLTSSPMPMSIAPAAPAIFTASQNGIGPAVVVNQDSSVGTPSPAGTVIQLYGTGFGVFAAPDADGLTRLAAPVTATVGGVAATVLYAGQAPGFTPGLQQINLLIPANAASGTSLPLQLTVGGITTQTGLTLTIQ